MPRARDAVICLEIFRPPRREQTPFLTNTCIYRRGIKSWNTSGKIRARKLTDSPFEGIFVKNESVIAAKSIAILLDCSEQQYDNNDKKEIGL